MNAPTLDTTDILIVGAGPVGTALSLLLAPRWRVTLLDAAPADQMPPERHFALAWSSREILDRLGLWRELEASATPIERVQVSERGRFGQLHLDRRHLGSPALGYRVSARELLQTLRRQAAKTPNLTLHTQVRATGYQDNNADLGLTAETPEGEARYRGRLLLIADGGGGLAAPESVQRRVYHQQALLTEVTADRPHAGRAFERFTDAGPLALLPLEQRRYAVIWCLDDAEAKTRQALDDAAFLDTLQQAFGDRAGVFSAPGRRRCHPLEQRIVAEPVFSRGLLMGNAAHTLHPLAGQGFNLSLRDAAALAERLGSAADPGDAALLHAYALERGGELGRIRRFTDGLLDLFARRDLPSRGLRRLGLSLGEALPPFKRRLLRRASGLYGLAQVYR